MESLLEGFRLLVSRFKKEAGLGESTTKKTPSSSAATIFLSLLGGLLIGIMVALAQHGKSTGGGWIQAGQEPHQYGENQMHLVRYQSIVNEAVIAKQALERVNMRLTLLKEAFVEAHPKSEVAYAALEEMEKKVNSGVETSSFTVQSPAETTPSGNSRQQGIGLGQLQTQCSDRSSKLSVVEDESDALASKLKKVAINNEILLAVSNKNLAAPGFMLDMWIKSNQASGVQNYMVACLDDETERFVESLGAPAFNMKYIIPENHGTHNHAVSALKFRILERFLKLGYNVLMSDVDILVLKDPFKYLLRDSDIEGMSDGYDVTTAYGYNDVYDDPKMGWSRYAHTMRIFVFNSGLFYVRATMEGLSAMVKTAEWLETKGGWDQAVFNEVNMFPSSSERGPSPNASRRVMDIYQFSNSKVFFCYMRKFPNFNSASRPVRPVLVHANYHPDKFERLKAIKAFYVDGDSKALDRFPCGEKE